MKPMLSVFLLAVVLIAPARAGASGGDTTPPVSRFDGPAFVLERVAVHAGVVSGASSDVGSGVARVDVIFTPVQPGSQVSVAASLACATPDRRTCAWSAEPPRAGVYEATASATDAAGNVELAGPSVPVIVG